MLNSKYKMGPKNIVTTLQAIRYSLGSIFKMCIAVGIGWFFILLLIQLGSPLKGQPFSFDSFFDVVGKVGLVAFLLMVIIPGVYRAYPLAHRWFSFEADGIAIFNSVSKENHKRISYREIERIIIAQSSFFNPGETQNPWLFIAYVSGQNKSGMPKLVLLGPKETDEVDKIRDFLIERCPKVKVFDHRK